MSLLILESMNMLPRQEIHEPTSRLMPLYLHLPPPLPPNPHKSDIPPIPTP
jgi:hypothetical protein